jgi:hypothetical protein
MAQGKARGTGRRFRFEARCNWCGSVQVEADGLHVFVSRSGAGLFEFRCPQCARANFRSLSLSDLEALALAGVRPAEGRAPFELLETRSGPPIAWDDLIDFHLALTGEGGGDEGTELRAHPEDQMLERDAA